MYINTGHNMAPLLVVRPADASLSQGETFRAWEKFGIVGMYSVRSLRFFLSIGPVGGGGDARLLFL